MFVSNNSQSYAKEIEGQRETFLLVDPPPNMEAVAAPMPPTPASLCSQSGITCCASDITFTNGAARLAKNTTNSIYIRSGVGGKMNEVAGWERRLEGRDAQSLSRS